jgi:hypothetical protein
MDYRRDNSVITSSCESAVRVPDIDEREASRFRRVDRSHDLGHIRFDQTSVICAQNQQRCFSPGQVLLIDDFLIGRDEKVKARLFGGTQQGSVLQADQP